MFGVCLFATAITRLGLVAPLLLCPPLTQWPPQFEVLAFHRLCKPSGIILVVSKKGNPRPELRRTNLDLAPTTRVQLNTSLRIEHVLVGTSVGRSSSTVVRNLGRGKKSLMSLRSFSGVAPSPGDMMLSNFSSHHSSPKAETSPSGRVLGMAVNKVGRC